MRPTRRSAIVAVLVLVGGFAFAACGRAQPGTALYIGGTRYTEKRIDELVDPIRQIQPDRDLRRLAVSTLALRELSKRAVEEKPVDVPAPEFASTSQRYQLPADSELNRQVAEFNALANALLNNVTAVSPTEQDLRDVYDAFVSNGQVKEGETYEAVAARMRGNTLLPQVLGLRNLLREQAEKVGVEVNPRYSPLVTIFGGAVPVVLSEGIGVVDRI
jgi:glycine betaine/choline ABC-type transport system substrate-binding protein